MLTIKAGDIEYDLSSSEIKQLSILFEAVKNGLEDKGCKYVALEIDGYSNDLSCFTIGGNLTFRNINYDFDYVPIEDGYQAVKTIMSNLPSITFIPANDKPSLDLKALIEEYAQELRSVKIMPCCTFNAESVVLELEQFRQWVEAKGYSPTTNQEAPAPQTSSNQIDATPEKIQAITADIALQFRTFGGGRKSSSNPIAMALENEPLQFAAGVRVSEVVRFVIDSLNDK